MSDFLTRGPVEGVPVFSFTGIKFVSIGGSIEFIGEITQVINGIALIKDPIMVGRDARNVNKFNLMKMHMVNPIVDNQIQVPLASISFMCSPNEAFVKNYLAARSGLVTPSTVSFDEGRNGR